MNTVALNDLHLMDIQTNDWLTVAIFAEEMPDSRWGHSLCASDDKLLLLGGMNLNTYCESVVFDIQIDDQAIQQHLKSRTEATAKPPKIPRSSLEMVSEEVEVEIDMGPVSSILD